MSNKPKYYAYSVRNRGKDKSAIWTRIGAVWAQEKGQGLNIDIEALPLNFDGKIVLMPPKSTTQAADTFESEVD
jgi:hypothetical protein